MDIKTLDELMIELQSLENELSLSEDETDFMELDYKIRNVIADIYEGYGIVI